MCGKTTVGKTLQVRFGFRDIPVGEIKRQITETSNGDLLPAHAVYNIISQKLSKKFDFKNCDY